MAGALSEDEAGLLAKVYAKPRVRDRFIDDQDWFVAQATKLSWPALQKRIARWVELADDDGPDPKPDPSHERRDASVVQDHFSKAWHLKGSLGSLDGSRFAEVFNAYYDAETALDWERARQQHGDKTTIEHLARTDAQRRADALSQIAEDAARNSGGQSGGGGRSDAVVRFDLNHLGVEGRDEDYIYIYRTLDLYGQSPWIIGIYFLESEVEGPMHRLFAAAARTRL